MEKQPKCSYCEIFGEKPHCHNCKINNKRIIREPQEIPFSLEELIQYINSSECILSEQLQIGDFKYIKLASGEELKIILIDFEKDTLPNNQGKAKATFCAAYFGGKFELHDKYAGVYYESKMRNVYLPRIFQILPDSLKDSIKPVLKQMPKDEGGIVKIVQEEEALWLFSVNEVLGQTSYTQGYTEEQYEGFEALARRYDYFAGAWTRSNKNQSHSTIYFYNDTTNLYAASANSYYKICFGFCI